MARQQFPFYKSFDDIVEDLTDAQLAKYIRTLLDVQFLRVKIDEVMFKDKMLNLVWKSQKHSINKSINGFLDGQRRDTIKHPFFGVYDTTCIPNEGVRDIEETPKAEFKGEVQGKEKGKVEVQVCSEFTFSLKKDTHFQNLSSEYITRLKDYIDTKQGMSFEEFRDGCLSKNSYKYKNFTLTYNKWNKNYTPPKRTESNIDASLEHNVFDLIDAKAEQEQRMIG